MITTSYYDNGGQRLPEPPDAAHLPHVQLCMIYSVVTYTNMFVHIYIYIYIYLSIDIYIYMYREREIERERCMYVYEYVYT